MTESSEFYAQTATDPRPYYGADIASFFRTQLVSGVVKGKLNDFVVSQHTSPNMSVDVATGEGWIYGYFVKSDEVENKTIDVNTSGQPRIDRIILRNAITGAKTITIEVLKGTPGAGAPGLTTDGTTYEVSLAQVAIANGASEILNANITDERIYVTLKYVSPDVLFPDADLDIESQKIINLAAGADPTDLMNKLQFGTPTEYYPVPAGTIIALGTTSIPDGFLACDGAEVSRTTYAALFAVIGTIYGSGDGVNTFNVPNAVGKFIIGYDSTDSDFNALGKTGGAATVTIDAATLPTHHHIGTNWVGTGYDWNRYNSGGANDGVPSGGTTGSTGGGEAHENLPPYLKLCWGIKI
jgi:microcystin-dependent protein